MIGSGNMPPKPADIVASKPPGLVGFYCILCQHWVDMEHTHFTPCKSFTVREVADGVLRMLIEARPSELEVPEWESPIGVNH